MLPMAVWWPCQPSWLMCLCSFASQPPLPPCSLNPALPHLKDDEGNDVQFRRTLLNKCQVRSGASLNTCSLLAAQEGLSNWHCIHAQYLPLAAL